MPTYQLVPNNFVSTFKFKGINLILKDYITSLKNDMQASGYYIKYIHKGYLKRSRFSMQIEKR